MAPSGRDQPRRHAPDPRVRPGGEQRVERARLERHVGVGDEQPLGLGPRRDEVDRAAEPEVRAGLEHLRPRGERPAPPRPIRRSSRCRRPTHRAGPPARRARAIADSASAARACSTRRPRAVTATGASARGERGRTASSRNPSSSAAVHINRSHASNPPSHHSVWTRSSAGQLVDRALRQMAAVAVDDVVLEHELDLLGVDDHEPAVVPPPDPRALDPVRELLAQRGHLDVAGRRHALQLARTPRPGRARPRACASTRRTRTAGPRTATAPGRRCRAAPRCRGRTARRRGRRPTRAGRARRTGARRSPSRRAGTGARRRRRRAPARRRRRARGSNSRFARAS